MLAAAAAAAAVVTLFSYAAPLPASAGIIPGSACKAIGDVSGAGGKACEALRNPKKLLDAGKNLVTGHIGSAINDVFSDGGASASTALTLAAIVAWVYKGAKDALQDMAKVINETAAPQLGSVWFSSSYWRMAAVSALLTLPFLFAAAVQALVRSDIALLGRAAFGHLPLALVGVGIAAPLTMLLLSGTDELCSLVWSPSATNGLTSLLTAGGVARVVGFVESPFLAFLLCIFTAGAGVLVWLELAMREAAVYIVVLLLPLAFAALVWPARRVWATRALEMLFALILSKFAIVAVLGLGGTALNHVASHGLGALLAGMVLVLLAAFAPWAVLRLVPLAEVASSAAGALGSHLSGAREGVWAAKEMKKADYALAGIAAHVAHLARLSNDGEESSGSDLSSPDALARNGGWAADNWEDAFEPRDAREDEEGDLYGEAAAGVDVAHQPDRVHVGAQVGGAHMDHVDPGAHMDHADPAAAGGLSDTKAADERVPGADPLWQAPDMSWPPMTLGLDDGWPPETPWPHQAAQKNGPAAAQRSDPDGQADPATTPPAAGGGAEQSDPLPPAQDRGGPL